MSLVNLTVRKTFINYFYFNQAHFLVLSSIVMNDRRSKYVWDSWLSFDHFNLHWFWRFFFSFFFFLSKVFCHLGLYFSLRSKYVWGSWLSFDHFNTYVDFGDFFLFFFVKSILSSGFIFFFKLNTLILVGDY